MPVCSVLQTSFFVVFCSFDQNRIGFLINIMVLPLFCSVHPFSCSNSVLKFSLKFPATMLVNSAAMERLLV